MNLTEKLALCDRRTQVFFGRIEPMMRNGTLHGWFSMRVAEIAEYLDLSPSLVYESLESLRVQGILAKGKRGYYCPAIAGEWVDHE